MLILITGATGFLGVEVVRLLVADGHRVRALVRATSNTRGLEALGVELHVGSLHPASGLALALQGVAAVVHCAGGGMTTSRQALYDNNLETTRALLQALDDRRGVRFLFLSSLAARGANGEPNTDYGRSKLQAEGLVSERSGRHHVTILRPPAIYGPGDRRMLPVFRAAGRGWVPLPRRSRRTALVHVRDCARAVSALLVSEHESGAVYYPTDGRAHDVADMVREVGRAMGRRVRVVRVPQTLLWVVAAVAELVGRMRGKAALLTLDKARDLAQPDWICDSGDLMRDTGWMPEVEFATGAAETATWYRENDWL